jgi:signal transduction histidine kinase
VLGQVPRDFGDRQLDLLVGLAGLAARHLSGLRDRHELARLRRREEDLVATISHELRTPVAVMQGYLEALADEDGLTPYRSLIEPIRRNGDRLVRMVDHLLAGTTGVQHPVTIQPGHLDLTCVAEAAVGGCLPQARANGVRIRLETAGIPRPVAGDFGRLCQVAEQLLRNAVAFSAAGDEVTVRVADGPAPSIEIVDHGVGIPADELPHLPERFFRGRHAREHAVPGLGLGLNIAERIVAAHGGTLSITSPGLGGGTTARLSVPALRQRPEHCSVSRRNGPTRPRTRVPRGARP